MVRNNLTAKKVVDSLARRNPRPNLRASLNSNVTHIRGNEYNEPLRIPVGESSGVKNVVLAPGNTNGRANAPVNAIGNKFQLGVYLPGTKVTYIPSVGLNTPGNIAMVFIDSSTAIASYLSLTTDAARQNFIFDSAGVKTGPVWQQMDYPINRAPRRRLFSTDITVTDQSEIDQSIQGYLLTCVFAADVNSGSTPKVVGQLVVHCNMRFEEVRSFNVG